VPRISGTRHREPTDARTKKDALDVLQADLASAVGKLSNGRYGTASPDLFHGIRDKREGAALATHSTKPRRNGIFRQVR